MAAKLDLSKHFVKRYAAVVALFFILNVRYNNQVCSSVFRKRPIFLTLIMVQMCPIIARAFSVTTSDAMAHGFKVVTA